MTGARKRLNLFLKTEGKGCSGVEVGRSSFGHTPSARLRSLENHLMTPIPMRWISNRMSAAYRHKRLRLAATIRAWIQVVGVVTALWVLFSAMGQDSLRATARAGYVLIAAGYLWLDAYSTRS